MKFLILILFFVASSPEIMAEDKSSIFVVDSGSKQVDDLIAQLVSRSPAPYPSMGVEIPSDFNGMSDDVNETIIKLRSIGPKIYPFLLKHLNDDRYSYSEEFIFKVGWEGIINITVGGVIEKDIFYHNLELYLYRERKDRNGKIVHQPNYLGYVASKGDINKWIETIKDQPRSKIEIDFFDWCIAYEKKRGFSSKKKEVDLLSRYMELRNK